MHLARVVVRNFRNFQCVDVALADGVTCVVGENNSGKSNFLHAIRLAADVNLPNYFRRLVREDIHGMPGVGGPHNVLVCLEFAGIGGDEPAEGLTADWLIGDGTRARITYRFRPSPSARNRLEDEEITADQLTMDDYQWDLTGGGDFDPLTLEWDKPAGASGIAFGILQQYRVQFLPALRDVEDDLKYFRKSPLVQLVNQLDLDEATKADIVSIVDTANTDIASKEPIKKLGEAISTRQSETAGPAFKQPLRLGFGEANFDGVAKTLIPMLSGVGLTDFTVARNGLGLNNILYIAMLLEYFANERAKKSAAGHLLLCEEPEAHLHPELQLSLMRAIRKDATQALVTSHSTHVTAGVGIGSCLCLTRKDDGESVLNAAAVGGGIESTQLADLDRYLDATRSRLLFARAVVLVEGPAEMLLIPALARKVLTLDLDSLGVCLVPVFGTHFAAFTALFAAGRLEKRCAVIADGDEAPRAGEDEGSPLVDTENNYVALNSGHVRTFVCRTTFERTLPRIGFLRVLQEVAGEVTAGPGTKVTAELGKTVKGALALAGAKKPVPPEVIAEAAALTLKLAKTLGKGRFAQVAARHAEQHAKIMPPYVAQALKWVVGNAADR